MRGHCSLLHPHCDALHDGLDSDDIIDFPTSSPNLSKLHHGLDSDGFPTFSPNLPKSPCHRRQSSSKRLTSSSLPRLPSSHLAKKGLGTKNIFNTIQITVHQPKVFQILDTHFGHHTQ
jgi:hypothetical protein